jgi:hypothetical protein
MAQGEQDLMQSLKGGNGFFSNGTQISNPQSKNKI